MVLSKRERNIGIVTGIAVAILVINFAIIDPLLASKNDLDKKVAEANATMRESVNKLKRAKEDAPRWTEISKSGLLRESSAAESQSPCSSRARPRHAIM